MDWIIVVHCLVFFIFWLTNQGFHPIVNKFLSDTTGLHLPFVMIFLILSSVIGILSAIYLVLKKYGHSKSIDRIALSLGVIYLIFFYGSFILLFLKNPVQTNRLGQFVQYFRLIVDTVLLLAISLEIRNWIGKQSKPWKRWIVVCIPIILGLIPFFWKPGAVLRGPLPEKPLLIAHRGASLLAPENTIAAMKKAVALGVYGVETDILISRDGVPFLMHDATLTRTTNVAEIFPNMINKPADNFTWDELSLLNAGQWFVDQDPFKTISKGAVSKQDVELYLKERIPTFSQLLEVVRSNNLWLIYDLRKSDGVGDYSGTKLDLILEEILTSGVEAKTWFLAANEEILNIQNDFPQAILAAGIDYRGAPSPKNLVSAGYELVNCEYGLSDTMIHAYQHSGLWVNIWTVDELWLYSRLWLLGVDSVTSNNIPGMQALQKPVMAMNNKDYIGVWGSIWIFSMAFAYSGNISKKKVLSSDATITPD
jgi:glycerophosphoryl diester phosphodiesterase